MPNRQISDDRKAIYYIGMVIFVIGLLTFASVFVTGISNFGDFSNFDERSRSEGIRAIVGMALFGLGAVLMGVGRAGLAGSGIVLDPEQAREDVEPWARAAGGVLKDALEETGLPVGPTTNKHEADDLPFDEKLRKLHKLLEEGLVTEEEYQTEKQRILEDA